MLEKMLHEFPKTQTVGRWRMYREKPNPILYVPKQLATVRDR